MTRKLPGIAAAAAMLLCCGVSVAEPLTDGHQWKTQAQYRHGPLNLEIPAETVETALAQAAESDAATSGAQSGDQQESKYRYRQREKKSYSYGKYGQGGEHFAASRHQQYSGAGGSTNAAAGRGRR